MEIGERLDVQSSDAWRAWLEQHHHGRSEIWTVVYKKATGKQALDYPTAVDMALCFGWIDSQSKSIDEQSYALRWSRRRPGGNWTETNKAKVRRLFAAGLMTEAGLAVLPADLRAELGVA